MSSADRPAVPEPPDDDVALEEDQDVLEEITLTAEVMIAANSSDGPLPQAEIDRALGVRPAGEHALGDRP